MAFRLGYLHLTLTHSMGQVRVPTHPGKEFKISHGKLWKSHEYNISHGNVMEFKR